MIIDSYMENGFYSTSNSVVAELANITPVDYSSCATVDEACMTAYLEMAGEYGAFETALREAEIAYVQEHGVAPVYEAANIKELVNQAIEHVKSWVAKMMGILDRFMKEVAAKIATARTKIFKGNKEKFDKGTWTSEMDFEDYDYDTATKIFDKPLVDAEEIFTSAFGFVEEDHASKEIAKFVAKHYNVDESTTVSVKSIKDKWLKKTTIDADYIKYVDVVDVIQNGYKNGLEKIKKTKADVNKSAAKTIKAIKDVAKKSDNKEEKKIYNKTIKAVSSVNSLNSILISAKLSIAMGWLNQAYKIAGMMYRSARKNTKDEKKAEKKDKKTVEAQNAAARIVGI